MGLISDRKIIVQATEAKLKSLRQQQRDLVSEMQRVRHEKTMLTRDLSRPVLDGHQEIAEADVLAALDVAPDQCSRQWRRLQDEITPLASALNFQRASLNTAVIRAQRVRRLIARSSPEGQDINALQQELVSPISEAETLTEASVEPVKAA